MNRWLKVLICFALGVAMLACGLRVPIYLRAVDSTVIERAGRNTRSFIEHGLSLVAEKKFGTAEMLSQAAQSEKVPGYGTLKEAVSTLALQNPELERWGIADQDLMKLPSAPQGKGMAEPFTEVAIRLENREKLLDLLSASSTPAVREVLRFREVTNTAVFPPSQSSSGQALDAALSICGLLLEKKCLTGSLSNSILTLAASANRGNPTQPFEQVLVDLMSLGQRLSWAQLADFVGSIEDPETLRLQAALVRKSEHEVPLLFSAVNVTGNPKRVVDYLMTFNQTGWQDLGMSLRCGVGGVNELLQRDQRLYLSDSHFHLGQYYCLRKPQLAQTLKWFLYFAGGFLIAMAMHFGRPAVSELERPLQVRGFHFAREILFALGFLVVVLLLSEPFLAQDSQKVDFPFRLRLPMVGGTVPAGPRGSVSIMNHEVLLTMLLFFTLQALLYVACIVKLAEIRRQRVPSRIKLKLLENEEHLFDGGLYLGFLGTIVSLILVSMGVFKQPSLMAAYSSTSFGILFVVIFKILHLRPARRKLLLEAETNLGESAPVKQSTVGVQL